MPTLTCPLCGTHLTVSPAAPPKLTCPRCLYHIANPFSGQLRQQQNLPPPPLPMRVLPVEDDTGRDIKGGRAGVILITVMLAIGLFILFTSTRTGRRIDMPFLLIISLVGAGLLVAAVMTLRKPKAPSIAAGEDAAYGDSMVLAYGRAAPKRPVAGLGYFAQAIAGIILGIAVAAGITITARGNDSALGIFVPAIAGVVLACFPGVRGLGVGMILAVPVAFLLLIGLCFAALGGMGHF